MNGLTLLILLINVKLLLYCQLIPQHIVLHRHKDITHSSLRVPPCLNQYDFLTTPLTIIHAHCLDRINQSIKPLLTFVLTVL